MPKREETQPTFIDGRGNERLYPIKYTKESFEPGEWRLLRERLEGRNLRGRLALFEKIVAATRAEFKDRPDAPEMKTARGMEMSIAAVRKYVAECNAESAAMNAIDLGHCLGRLELFAVKEDWARGRKIMNSRLEATEKSNAIQRAKRARRWAQWDREAQEAKKRRPARTWTAIAHDIAKTECAAGRKVSWRTVYNHID